MTWFEQSPNAAEADKPHCAFFVAVDIAFPSGHVRVWTGVGELTIDGNFFSGLGSLISMASPSENNRLIAEQKSYQLSGVDPALVPEADIDGSHGGAVIEYVGFLDTVTNQLVAAPEINWEGYVDSVSRQDGLSPIIEVTAFHRVANLDRSCGLLYTHAHQQALFPGDDFFDQVPGLALKTIVWGGVIAPTRHFGSTAEVLDAISGAGYSNS